MPPSTAILVRLDPELAGRLRRTAKSRRTTAAGLIRQAVAGYLNDRELEEAYRDWAPEFRRVAEEMLPAGIEALELTLSTLPGKEDDDASW